MYETLWDDIINKRAINKINETYFDSNITLVSALKNIVGIQGFKEYYQNYLNGFSELTFTIISVLNKVIKLLNIVILKEFIHANFSEFQLLEKS
jgi:hypothetical protein